MRKSDFRPFCSIADSSEGPAGTSALGGGEGNDAHSVEDQDRGTEGRCGRGQHPTCRERHGQGVTSGWRRSTHPGIPAAGS